MRGHHHSTQDALTLIAGKLFSQSWDPLRVIFIYFLIAGIFFITSKMAFENFIKSF